LLLLAAWPTWLAAGEIAQVFDRRTGSTLQLTGAAWVLALDQPHLAAHARDYVALHGLEVSNGGRREYFLAVFYWSTVPGRNRHAGDHPVLRLLLDDRDVRLAPSDRSLRDNGISRWPLGTPGRDALLILYAVEPGLLRQFGHATRVRARPEPAGRDAADQWFEPWREARGGFQVFAQRVLPQP
jgi:hypothetical protein